MANQYKTKEEAKQAGANKYFSDEPCSHGHVGMRYLSGDCVQCRSEIRKRYAAANRDKIKAYQETYRDRQNELHKEYRDAHKEERAAYHKDYSKKNADKFKGYRRKYRETNAEAIKQRDRISWIKTKYGLTVEQYDAMIHAQSGQCAICGGSLEDTRKTHIDHCHSTGQVRGVLCHACNVGLGHFKDDVDVLARAINYLQKTVDPKSES